MKRRDFLRGVGRGAVGLGLLGTGLGGGDRPTSASDDKGKTNSSDGGLKSHLLKLHLALDQESADMVRYYEAIADVAEDVYLNPDSMAQFVADPDGYLARKGFPGVVVATSSREYRLLAVMADPEVRKAGEEGDVVKFVALVQQRVGGPNVVPEMPSEVFMIGLVVAFFVVVFLAFYLYLYIVEFVYVCVEPVLPVVGANADLVAAARSVGGHGFAADVVRETARKAAQLLIDGIEDGRITLPAGVSKDAAIASIQAGLARHTP